MVKSSLLISSAIVLLIAGCNTHAAEEPTRVEVAAPSGTSDRVVSSKVAPQSVAPAKQDTSPAPPKVAEQASSVVKPDYIDEDGSRYTWIRTLPDMGPGPATAVEEPVLTGGQGNGGGGGKGTGGGGGRKIKLIADMTVEELAAKLRPRLFLNGEEYLLDHDPIEAAKRAKENFCPPTEGYNPGYPVDVGQGGVSRPEMIINGEDREWYDINQSVHNTITWPAMTNLHLQTSLGGCTATTIGLRTAASAAHCFTSNGMNVSTSNTFTKYKSDVAPVNPYGQLVVSNTGILIPSGWNGTDWQWDMARVTFPANTFSGWGYVSTAFVGYGASGTPVMIWGYPSDKPYPELWLGTGIISSSSWFPRSSYICNTRQSLRHTADIWNGNSGGALMTRNPVNLIGIQSTHYISGTYKSNEARQWDSVAYAHFSTGGLWP